MSQYPVEEWSTSRIIETVVAGLVPLVVVGGFIWLRMPRDWMRCNSPMPNWMFWGTMFLLSLVWIFLGISLPIALFGVDSIWWVLPLTNLVLAILAFIPIFQETSLALNIFCLLMALGTAIQYGVAQHSWIAALCTMPYILWCIFAIRFAWRLRIKACVTAELNKSF